MKCVCLALILAAAALGQGSDDPFLQELPVVDAAALHSQTLEQAPASVTVITAKDIRKYGYRTLAEVLASARGFFTIYDRIYLYAGVRGFGLPGDYNVRFLVMINGHKLADNIYAAAGAYGQDFGLDLDLVQRIEIIRGPSSALYGSNGILATVNIITKSPVDLPAAQFNVETDSLGERKATVVTSAALGRGANLLVSASVFNSAAQSLFFPAYIDANGGWTRADGERGYHGFANLIWGRWSLTAMFDNREKQVPINWGETIFADPANKVWDGRNYVEAAYTRGAGTGREFRWRLYYDQVRYSGRFDYELDGAIEDNRDIGYGDWVGTEASYSFPLAHFGTLTAGGELNADVRTLQQNLDVAPTRVYYLDINTRDRWYGLFAQHEWSFAPKWTLYTGVRFDDSKLRSAFVSPRLALVYQHSPATVVKLLYGRSFRNPSASELYYEDNGLSSLANPYLRPEKANSFEAIVERKLNQKLSAVVSGYQFRLSDLIQTVHAADGPVQNRTVARIRSTGIEGELSGRPWRDWEAAASFAFQRTSNVDLGQHLPDSPEVLAKLRLGVPARRWLFLSAQARYMSSRLTLSQLPVSPVVLLDATATTVRLNPRFDFQFGVRNLADRHYDDPIALVSRMDRIAQDGRSVFVKLILRTPEPSATPVHPAAAAAKPDK